MPEGFHKVAFVALVEEMYMLRLSVRHGRDPRSEWSSDGSVQYSFYHPCTKLIFRPSPVVGVAPGIMEFAKVVCALGLVLLLIEDAKLHVIFIWSGNRKL